MTRLPQLSGQQLVRVLEQLGYRVVRQKGSHIRLAHDQHSSISVPKHQVIGKGLLHKILRDTGLPPDKLRTLL